MSTRPQVLPSSVESERAILGAVLLSNGERFPEVAAVLTADDFSLDSHRRIYARMSELAEESIPIDLVTLVECLDRHGELESVGGATYVSSLTDGLPRLENIGHYTELARQKSGLRRILSISNATAAHAMEGEEHPEEIAARAQRMLSDLTAQAARGPVSFLQIFRERYESLDRLQDMQRSQTGVPTGFRRLDQMTNGIHRGELTLIAARPGMGKTALALNISANVARTTREPVLIFSLEMTAPSLILRMLCSEASVDSHRLRQGFASREDWARLAAALGRMADCQIFIDDQATIRPEMIFARAKALQQRLGSMALVVVDYLQLIDAGNTRDSRVQEVSRISRAMKLMAKELDCPVLALSQLNRQVEDRNDAPRLSDLRESGTLEQDADAVFFIWKERQNSTHRSRDIESMGDTRTDDGQRKLIIAKQRNGPTGEIGLCWLARYTRFENLAEEWDGDDEATAAANQNTQRTFGE